MNRLLVFVFVFSLNSYFALSCCCGSKKSITDEVYFYLHIRTSPNVSIELNPAKLSQIHNLENVNCTSPWKFFVHGYTTNPAISPWFHTGKQAYFNRGDYNVVFVDWSKPANETYVKSCLNANQSGLYFARFLIKLTRTCNISMDQIHLLGHSLGSHMVGFAGKHVQLLTGLKLGRITAPDPAGPYFEFDPYTNDTNLLPENERLSSGDAKFVDVIHTDGGHYGMTSSIGHVDVFPNGGFPIQPGCELTNDENCSHARSTKFYVESINSKQFVATKCTSYNDYKTGHCNKKSNIGTIIFGEDVDQTVRGKFYLLTNSEPPYAKDE